ncbi:MAG: hypothetical protein IT430_03810 [Phycisphaerales bacterium]|nr:hypothetical protein [Phycisphaerales bacterium]
MTARLPRSRAYARVARLEARVAVAQKMTIHEACDRWTDRYEAASADHADLIRRIIDRRKVLNYTWFGEPGKPRPCAAHLSFGLIYQAPDRLWPKDGLPPKAPLVPDSNVVVALFMEFMNSLVEYQISRRDLYPREQAGIRELALQQIARRRELAAAAARADTATDAHLKCSTEKTPAVTGVGEA